MTPLICTWAIKHNISQEAVRELMVMMGTENTDSVTGSDKPEARVQDAARLEASKLGWRLWRQNVGALKDDTGRIVRYGLCNDTPAMNKRVKSSDLIGLRPVIITPDMVGTTLGQFVAREIKKEGWKYKGNEHEQAQLRFGEIVTSLGGDFKFWNGNGAL